MSSATLVNNEKMNKISLIIHLCDYCICILTHIAYAVLYVGIKMSIEL